MVLAMTLVDFLKSLERLANQYSPLNTPWGPPKII